MSQPLFARAQPAEINVDLLRYQDTAPASPELIQRLIGEVEGLDELAASFSAPDYPRPVPAGGLLRDLETEANPFRVGNNYTVQQKEQNHRPALEIIPWARGADIGLPPGHHTFVFGSDRRGQATVIHAHGDEAGGFTFTEYPLAAGRPGTRSIRGAGKPPTERRTEEAEPLSRGMWATLDDAVAGAREMLTTRQEAELLAARQRQAAAPVGRRALRRAKQK